MGPQRSKSDLTSCANSFGVSLAGSMESLAKAVFTSGLRLAMDWSDRIGRRIKLRDLHILMAVADTGSMAKAAARLRISHPAVSRANSEIEGTLGVQLFDRGSQGVDLTAHGEVLLRCGI